MPAAGEVSQHRTALAPGVPNLELGCPLVRSPQAAAPDCHPAAECGWSPRGPKVWVNLYIIVSLFFIANIGESHKKKKKKSDTDFTMNLEPVPVPSLLGSSAEMQTDRGVLSFISLAFGPNKHSKNIPKIQVGSPEPRR